MYLNINGRLKEFDRPLVMGIVNLTSDSFYAGSRYSLTSVVEVVAKMMADGADMIDIGACSTRPGSQGIDACREIEVLVPAIREVRKHYPDTIISADTFRSETAIACVAAGGDIINDISGGDMDGRMFDTIARLKVPYIITHMRGTPETMQQMTNYNDVTAEVLSDLAFKVDKLHQLGVCDVIVDPGFGFAKTLDQNYTLLGQLEAFKSLNCPILAGLSRKSMIYKELGCSAEEALNGTTVVNTMALLNGADILRVHDVKEAREAVEIYSAYARNVSEKHTLTTKVKNGTIKTRLI